MTPSELTAEMVRLSRLLDDGIDAMRRFAREYADAEDDYRLARARAHAATEGTVDDAAMPSIWSRQRNVVPPTTPEAMKQAATEAVRARRAQLSALQSLMSAYRADAEFARTGPEMAA